MDDLALPPVPVALVVADEALELTPLKVGELPAFTRAIRPFAERLGTEPDWLALLAEHGEAVLAALAIASRQPRAWIDGLDLDEAIRLAEALLEVNADFFVRRVSPQIARAAASLEARIRQTAGAAPSRD